MHARSFLAAATTSVALMLAIAPAALGAPSHRTVQILDNCGPSFNDALFDGACTRSGGMSFDTFVAQLLAGGAESWRFAPEQVRLGEGGRITAVNRGGEFHTFTPVAAFGGGCIAELNGPLGLIPVAECAQAPAIFGQTGVMPGATRTTEPLDEGVQRFQCLIHPWQRTTAIVD